MSLSTEFLVIGLLTISGSGFFLKYYLRFNTSFGNCIAPLLFAILGISSATYLRSFPEAIEFLLAATVQFASFVFVSRLRQRGSFFWHVMAAFASNGAWFATMRVLDKADSYWMLFILYIMGIIIGRTAGVLWAQYIEQAFNLKSDATRDSRMEPGKRMQYIMNEKTFWALVLALVFYIAYGYVNFEEKMFTALLIVIGLGVLQNFSYALATRAGQRGNDWYIATAGVAAGITFYISATYLFSKGFHLQLFLPYVLSTSLGSATGAFSSMIIEWTMKLAPDTHLEKDRKQNNDRWHQKPYVFILLLAGVWITIQEPLFRYFGMEINKLTFPLIKFDSDDISRIIIVLVAAVFLMLDSALHTITSRAGNRNHTPYHIVTCIPKGLADFFKVSYIELNKNIPDIIPVAVLAGCLGSLYGKNISERVERVLQSRMDVPRENKK